jgi:cytochrome c oxidase subunit 2
MNDAKDTGGHPLDKLWISIGAVTLFSFFVCIVLLSASTAFSLPSDQHAIDPDRVDQTPPFDKPGIRQTGAGRYEAYYVGRIFSWSPKVVTIPVNSTVTFYATTADVVHGFFIPNENVNLEVVPGWISSASHTFHRRGTFLIICDQYCGAGHQAMYSEISVK